jgi:hypothetical protein
MSVEHAPIEKIPFPEDADPKRQAAEVPGTRRPGQTGILLFNVSLRPSLNFFAGHYRNGVYSAILSVNYLTIP